jgi:hypothetical protein
LEVWWLGWCILDNHIIRMMFIASLLYFPLKYAFVDIEYSLS